MSTFLWRGFRKRSGLPWRCHFVQENRKVELRVFGQFGPTFGGDTRCRARHSPRNTSTESNDSRLDTGLSLSVWLKENTRE